MIIVKEGNDIFKEYIKRFNVKNTPLKNEGIIKSDEVFFSKKGFNFSIEPGLGCEVKKESWGVLLKTNDEFAEFILTSHKKFYIEMPLYVKNRVELKRKADNCFKVKIYKEKEGGDIKLKVIFNNPFSASRNVNVDFNLKIGEL